MRIEAVRKGLKSTIFAVKNRTWLHVRHVENIKFKMMAGNLKKKKVIRSLCIILEILNQILSEKMS